MNTLFKFVAIVATFSTIAFAHSKAEAQQVPLNVAVVNIEKVLGLASAPKSIREQVQKKRESYRNEIQAEEAALRTANQELAQKQTLLSPEAFKEERSKFEQKVLEVQKKVQQRNIQLQNSQKAAQEEVKKALRDVVLKLSQEKNYTLVLRSSQTVIVADNLDITDAVIKALNAKLPTITVFK